MSGVHFLVDLLCELLVISDSIVAIRPVVRKLTDGGLPALNTSSGFPKKTVRYIFTYF